jgi:DNA helicase-2/ATP-dependent DNA helicase PcrA
VVLSLKHMIQRQKLQEHFLAEYARLNDAQKEAVDTIEGPVMVIAGPGTGKTQILASRIGKILLDTDAQAENILCLTYTDAGVVAMRKRLLQFIGTDAYKVNINTFHAFCNEVIQENLSLFDKNSLDPISELERIELYTHLIDQFPKGHPLKRYRGDVYFEMNNLQRLFSSMKREGWKPEFLNEQIDAYLNDLPTRDEYIAKRKVGDFKKGDVRWDKIEEEKEKMDKLRAAVNEFYNYQDLMRKRNRYDFDDMINWVIEKFESDKNLLAHYQEKYLYILVDEYQDTSGTQNRIVELLINFWEEPNIFVVGDDDQSIYRFQGANMDNMLVFRNRYADLIKVIVLSNNYRSTQPILDVSKSLIERNDDRLINRIPDLSKQLIAAHPKYEKITLVKPVIREYTSVRMEMVGITLEVSELIQKGVEPGKIAVIYKENKYGEELAQYYKIRNIPVFSKRHVNVLHTNLIEKFVLLLNYLDSEHDIPYSGDEMLFEILHFDWFKIPPIQIAQITAEVADKQFKEDAVSLRKLLYDKANLPPRDLFSPAPSANLVNASKAIEQLIKDVPNQTLQGLIECCIRQSGLLGTIMQSEEKVWLLQILTAFFDFIKEETRRTPTLQLHGLVNMLKLMIKEEIPINLIQVSGTDKGVNLLTAHGSKGLEFEYVFFAGCNASSWEKKRKPGGGYKIPDTVIGQTNNNNDLEELRRLFYVALTRAEQHLTISYSRFKNDNRDLEPSMFIAEIIEKYPLGIESIQLTNEQLTEFELVNFQKPQRPEIDHMEQDLINRMLEKFVMNVTALNNYLKCPLDFYFKNLIRIPSPKNEATEFGSAVHHALEQLFMKMKQDPNEQFHGKDQFIADFKWYMKRHRESFTKEQYERRLEYGEQILNDYYETHVKYFNKVVVVERSIRNVTVKNVPLKGKLDKLEFNGSDVNVVDYKTGDPDNAKNKLVRPNPKEPKGGDYWRQAVFYKILVDNNESKNWKVVSTEFDFVEPNKKKEYKREKVVITPEDIEFVTGQIVEVWNKIQQKDFYVGCGSEDCHWCNFVKTNQLAVALHDLEEPDEQDF